MGSYIFVIKVLIGLALFFAFIISMAVGNGILAGLAQDTDRAREGRIMGSWQTGYVINEYKRLNPEGRKHIQAYMAFGIGALFFISLIVWALLAWR